MAAFFTLLDYRDPLFRRPCRGQCRPNFTSIRSVRSDGPWSASVAWQFREISCILCLWVLLSNRPEWVSETWWPDHHTSISLALLSSRTRPSCDRILLAAQFSSHDSWVIGGYSMIIWCSNIHVWIFFLRINIHVWLLVTHLVMNMLHICPFMVSVFSIWGTVIDRYRHIFDLMVSFSMYRFFVIGIVFEHIPYRFWVKKYDMKW
jgi:hypothetical protein